jgi:predicted ATPase/DNA-binding CsgD family transcriptional regulator/DNA-binding XRE family transcriptional regulator
MQAETVAGPSFAQLLRQHRLASGLTQAELAQRSGLSGRGISDLERGLKLAPRASTLRLLARGLGLHEADAAEFLRAARTSVSAVGGDQQLGYRVPLSLTSFIGRADELAEIHRLLGVTRLLTLCGPGGIGKTRLALQAVQVENGTGAPPVAFVDLSPLTHASLVAQTIAASLGIRELAGQPTIEALIDALRTQRALLVLDNCEHLLAACAATAEALLRGCPHLRLLATSREVLGIGAELVWPVPPLSLPGPGSCTDPEQLLLQCESVRLFVDRARSARVTFALNSDNGPAVVRICRQLDGIPLAIELAAARTKALSAEQIADRLSDRFALLTTGPRGAPPRHQTLGSAIAWSYDLLNPAERRLFDRVSVFAGGWTLDAIEALSGVDGPGVQCTDVLDHLTRLIETSMVSVEEQDGAARYFELETLRAYGAERLAASGQAETIRARHATFYLALVEAAATRADGPEHNRWTRLLETEHDNLRAALSWLTAHDPARGLRLAGAMARFWYLRGLVTEGCRWLEDLLAASPERTPAWTHAALSLARLLELRRDEPRAREFAEMSLTSLRSAGDLGGAASATRLLGMRALEAGDFTQARMLCDQSLTMARQAADRRAIAEVLGNLGLLDIHEGDLPRAKRRFEETLSLGHAIGYRHADVNSVPRLGVIARLEGDYPRARSLIEEGLRLAEAFGHRPATCSYLVSLANLARCEGGFIQARCLLVASLELAQRDVGVPLLLLNALAGLGALAVAQRAYRKGVRLLAACAAAGAPHGTLQVPELRYDVESALAAAREALDPSAYSAAWAEGQSWSSEEAINRSLATSEPASGPAMPAADAIALTPRQCEVAVLVARGRTNRQIGEALVITEGTARVHVEHILAKLDLHSRAQLAGWAVARGLVTPLT